MLATSDGRRRGAAGLARGLVAVATVAAVLVGVGGTRTDAVDLLPMVVDDVEYARVVDASGAEVSLRLDVYRPPGLAPGERRAVVLWIHGGGFGGGSKDESGDVAIAQLLGADGYAVVSIDYRLRPIATLADAYAAARDAQADAQTAVGWVRTHADEYGFDPGRIVAAGFSAGGMTAVHTAYRTFGDLGTTPPSTDGAFADDSIEGAISLSGFGVLPDLAGAPDAPALFVHGFADPLIRFDLAGDTCKKLVAADRDCELVGLPDGHGVVRYLDPVHRYVLDWLARHHLAPAA